MKKTSLRLYTTADPEVRQESTPVSLDQLQDPVFQAWLDDLVQAMIDFNGIGIAAVQVGRTIQAIVVDKQYTHTPEHLILINPRLVSTSPKTWTLVQGCLSVPGASGAVTRPARIRVKALDRHGAPLDIKAKGMYAQVLQHEIDHLEGTLFIDRATRVSYRDDSDAIDVDDV
jgi:peptide deformylase